MSFDYYLFDLDNCLLYIPNPSEYFDKVLMGTLKELTLKSMPNRQERNLFWLSGEKYNQLLEKWGADTNTLDFWKIFDHIDFTFRLNLIKEKEILLYNDVKNVLEELYYTYKKKLAIISNSADYIVDHILNTFGIKHFIQEIFALSINNDQSLAKPSPEGILQTLKKLNYIPNRSRALMIGDSMSDIYAAKKAQIFACLIKRDLNKYVDGFEKWKFKPDFIINQLNEIFEL